MSSFHIHSLPGFRLLICGAFLIAAAQSAAADGSVSSPGGDLSIGLGFEFASGTFGTGTRTDFITAPLTLGYRPAKRVDLELVIPYVYQSNSSTVYGSTIAYRNQYQDVSAATAAGRYMSGPGGQEATSASYDTDSSYGGLGDITFTAGYELLAEDEIVPQVRASIYAKFPTASRNKGLGTGEFDIGPGLGLDKWYGDWDLFAEARYIFQGESELYATKDYLNYTAGIGFRFTDSFYAALAAKGATEPAEDSPDLFEGRLKCTWRITEGTDLEGYVSKGFTDGSPEYGSGLALFYYF